jgi:hypothetical protein
LLQASARLCLKSNPYFHLFQVVIVKYGILSRTLIWRS